VGGKASWRSYLPAARRWKRVRFSIFLCFFLRIRLRRFLMSEPMASGNLPASPCWSETEGQEFRPRCCTCGTSEVVRARTQVRVSSHFQRQREASLR